MQINKVDWSNPCAGINDLVWEVYVGRWRNGYHVPCKQDFISKRELAPAMGSEEALRHRGRPWGEKSYRWARNTSHNSCSGRSRRWAKYILV